MLKNSILKPFSLKLENLGILKEALDVSMMNVSFVVLINSAESMKNLKVILVCELLPQLVDLKSKKYKTTCRISWTWNLKYSISC